MEKIIDLKVETKRMPSGVWSCYTTFGGIDKAFTGKDIGVVSEMAEWLKKKPININIIWVDPVIHEPIKAYRKYNFIRPKLDNF